VETGGGTDAVRPPLQGGALGELGVLELLDGGKVPVDQHRIGQGPQVLGRLQFRGIGRQEEQVAVVVHAASLPDRKGGQWVLEAAGDAFPRLQHIWADQGYTGTMVRWAAQEHGWQVQVVYPQFRQLKRYAPELLAELGYESGFRVIPHRWVVERTFSWLGRQRRLSKDYERLASTEEVFIYLVAIRLLLARLAPA
jgi:putative transposase